MVNLSYTSSYNIINDAFVAGNVVFNLYPYQSELEKKFSKELKDPEFAKDIAKAFEIHLLPKIVKLENSKILLDLWETYLVRYSALIGIDVDHSCSVFLNKAFSAELKEFIRSHSNECRNFFSEIAKMEEVKNLHSVKQPQTVVILSSSSGGGHEATAQAVKEFMEQSGYKLIILDPDRIVEKNDPLYLGGFKYKDTPINMSSIYSLIFQQENNVELAYELWGKGDEIRQFQPDKSVTETIKAIRQINPVRLLSVASHHREHLSFSSRTGIPLDYIHTDFGFNNALLSIADKVNKQVRFWVNAEDKELLELDQSVLQGLKTNSLDEEPLESYELMLQELKKKGTIQVCGFPIRQSFMRERTLEDVISIKTKMNIPADEHVILLAMGRFGIASHVIKYMNLLTDSISQFEKPIHLIIICGRNEGLKKMLMEEEARVGKEINSMVTFHVKGNLNQEEMAELAAIANLEITKPGGVTSAEAVSMNLPLLVPEAHSWELPNLSYLKRRNLAEQLVSDETFVLQVKKLLVQEKPIGNKPINWQERFVELLNS